MKYLVMINEKEIPCQTMEAAEIAARNYLIENISKDGRYAVIFEAVKEVTIEFTTKFIPLRETYEIAGHKFPLTHAEKIIFAGPVLEGKYYHVKIKDMTDFNDAASKWYVNNSGKIYKVCFDDGTFHRDGKYSEFILPEHCEILSEAQDG